MFIYFGAMPSLGLVVAGVFTENVAIFGIMGVIFNLICGAIFFLITPAFFENGKK